MITSHAEPHDQTETLRARLAEAEEMLRAIRQGEIDALVVEGPDGNQVYTLHSADEPYRHLVEQMQEGAVVLTDSRRHPVLQRPLRGARGRAARVGGRQPHRPIRERVRPGRFRGAARSRQRDDRRSRLIGSDSGAFEVSLSLTTTVSSERRSPESDRDRSHASSSRPTATATAPSATAARRTSSWRCWPTSCAIRSARSATPSGCSS